MTIQNEMQAISIYRKDPNLDESFNNPYQEVLFTYNHAHKKRYKDEKMDITICLKSYNFDHHIPVPGAPKKRNSDDNSKYVQNITS